MQAVAAEANPAAGMPKTQVYTPLRQALYAAAMRKMRNKDVNAFADTMQELNEALARWLYQPKATEAVGWQYQPKAGMVVEPARPWNEYSVLMTMSKTMVRSWYHRPSWLLAHRYCMVEAGSAGVNNCLPQSMIKGLVMNAKVLGIKLPKFLSELDNVPWGTLLNVGEVPAVQVAAVLLRKQACSWLRNNREQIVAQYTFASDMCAEADLGTMTAELDKEIQSLGHRGMLGLLSHSALVQAMHQLDHAWFEEHGFRILSYGAGSTTSYPDRIIEFLPWNLQELQHAIRGRCAETGCQVER